MGEFATFTDVFHDFVGDCIDSRTPPEPTQSDTNQAMADCVAIWVDAREEAKREFEPPSESELRQEAVDAILRSD